MQKFINGKEFDPRMLSACEQHSLLAATFQAQTTWSMWKAYVHLSKWVRKKSRRAHVEEGLLWRHTRSKSRSKGKKMV